MFMSGETDQYWKLVEFIYYIRITMDEKQCQDSGCNAIYKTNADQLGIETLDGKFTSLCLAASMPMSETVSTEPQRTTGRMNSRTTEGNGGQQHDLSDRPTRCRHSKLEMQQMRPCPIEKSKWQVAQS